MPAKQTEVIPDITVISDSQSSQAEELPSTAKIDPEITVTVDIKFGDGNTDENEDKREDSQTSAIPPPVGCSTELAHRRTTKDADHPNPNRITAKGLEFNPNRITAKGLEFNPNRITAKGLEFSK